MVILKQFKKKNKSIQIFPFVMKDDYLIVVLTMMVTLSLKIRLELASCKIKFLLLYFLSNSWKKTLT